MPPSHISNTDQVQRFIKHNRLADLKSLMHASSGRARSSLFRDLDKLNYISSFTHAGRYFTLPGIPDFDHHGLWFHKDIGFSLPGTLKNTLAQMVNRSQSGYFHRELEYLLRIPVHNTLLDLCRCELIQRQSLEPHRYLYLSADPQRAGEQLRNRKTMLSDGPLPQPPLHVGSLDTVIAILVETIRAACKLPSINEVVRRLALRDVSVLAQQVEQIWAHYGIHQQKKTAESKPPPLKR